MAPARHYSELIAWKLAEEFSGEAQRLVEASPMASRNFRYRDQLLDAASDVPKDIAEGFVRYSAATFILFLDYALASLVEGELRLKDGIRRGYFLPAECEGALRLARRCLTATVRLKKSQERYLRRHRRRRRPTGVKGS